MSIHRSIHRPVLLGVLAAALATSTATTQRTLDQMRRRIEAEQQELRASKGGQMTFEDLQQLANRHTAELAAWLGDEAQGTDRINGRLFLTNIYMEVGQEDAAREALRALDVDTAPAMELTVAAEMAGYLGMPAERARWIRAAADKDAPFEEKMAVAIALATRLEEVERAEAIFTAATEAAEDDETRAHVGWYRCAMIREREDLPDGSYDEALAALAKQYPDTYWGGIARDRRAALDLRPDVDAIAFDGPLLRGDGRLKLADFDGKVVLLDFWASWTITDNERGVHAVLKRFYDEFHDDGLEIVGVNLDPNKANALEATERSGRSWPQIWDGRGWKTDTALRYGIEQVPDHVLIGRDGKVAAVRVYLQDEYGVEELRGAIRRALQAGGR